MENVTSAKQPISNNTTPSASLPVNRVASVDVYRGFVMLLMMGEVLSFSSVSKALPGNAFWDFMHMQQSHVEWTWLVLHDMIQPSFTFLVGVILPYSIASRKNKGATVGSLMSHTIKRSFILIFLGVFLRSMYSTQSNFTFEDTLSQIGLGYTFLVLLGFYSQRVQVISLIVILVGYWLAFAMYPLPGPGFDYASARVTADWEHNLTGFAAHWNKNTNIAWAFDKWFLNLFPRKTPFTNNGGGYSTLSFIPTLGTMILGLIAGNTLHSSKSAKEKLNFFIKIGLVLLALGIILQVTGINPIVKRIWTPAWTIFSGGICFLFLAFFYSIVDMAGKKKWSYFLMVIGANSIAAYVMADAGFSSLIRKSLFIHFGPNFDKILGDPYATLVSGGITLFILWLILNWMYKKKIFIKI
jgi:predicted acyltransferase